MDTFIERQGFYDYINHFITGVILIISAEILRFPFKFSLTCTIYKAVRLFRFLEKYTFLWNVCVLLFFSVVCFLLGVLMQELYSIIYERKPCKKKRIHSFFSRLFIKVNKDDYAKRIFQKSDNPNDSIIHSDLKRALYKKYASDILMKKPLKIVVDDDLSSFFFAFCVYYIQIRNQDSKTEKLRDIEGMSKSLSLAFLILAFVALLPGFIVCLLWHLSGCAFLFELVCFFVFSFLSIIFDFRTEEALKNRIRITLAIYEAEKQREIKDEKDRSSK